jgi:hypothetical protein
MTIDERLLSLETRLADIEASGKGSWFAAITPYLPELRSILWALGGLVLGSGGTVATNAFVVPTPLPVVAPVVTAPTPEKIEQLKPPPAEKVTPEFRPHGATK